jgi:hypothetical protein
MFSFRAGVFIREAIVRAERGASEDTCSNARGGVFWSLGADRGRDCGAETLLSATCTFQWTDLLQRRRYGANRRTEDKETEGGCLVKSGRRANGAIIPLVEVPSRAKKPRAGGVLAQQIRGTTRLSAGFLEDGMQASRAAPSIFPRLLQMHFCMSFGSMFLLGLPDDCFQTVAPRLVLLIMLKQLNCRWTELDCKTSARSAVC